MAYNQDHRADLLNQICRDDVKITKKIALLSRVNVNTYIQEEPLIANYLTTKLNMKVLSAFANNGCNFNVQGRDGQTPLQLLVAKELSTF